jgi:hypothetical protein
MREALLEGRGGQQLLLERAPFCPGRHCLKRCSAHDCTCQPCRMPCCRRRPRRGGATPDLFRAFQAPTVVQSRLFTTTRSTS